MTMRASAIAVALCPSAALSASPSAQLGTAQQLGQVRHNSGQNVVPVYEGWERNSDGSFNLVFGYMNRNYQEQPELPIGPDNSISPGPADQGQPTHFYPRRQQFMFKVRVPADFGKKEVVWTLTRNGQTEKAFGTLLMEEELTQVVISENRGGLANDSVKAVLNRPPVVSVDGPTSRTAAVGETVVLTASASDDGIPKPPPPRAGGDAPPVAVVDGVPLLTPRDRPTSQAIVKPSRKGLAVTWTQWRGPGELTFEPPTSVVADGKASTKVAFASPGTYVVRAFADDGVVTTPADVTVVVGSASKTSGQP
jgi:hypothetical protein